MGADDQVKRGSTQGVKTGDDILHRDPDVGIGANTGGSTKNGGIPFFTGGKQPVNGGKSQSDGGNSSASNGGKAEKDAKADPEPDAKAVSLAKLFSFADPLDVFLMILGSVAAMGAGSTIPLLMILFGDLVNSFGKSDEAHVVHAISEVGSGDQDKDEKSG
ncbi:hypothetical protein CBR_g90975 [Chara braunii]|uniref:ABC transmembrane type-1 domain-containing protein n=1 Tax=Chara braunii TaxID=69332 RepID=A0A388JLC9_CHABU|nr:hypothetical protein CBR_g90975 [Chara braunii]|eukprot:GBG48473.1 hypothetical protein CBR_g90975 [Chara braunii]